ncbi:MAG: transglutaminase-like domain-containing protein [Ardenticatenaceae bacterium]|nr:transglutaminase-like domain-containing protein [Ardenticatenaceae bacterium]
MNKSKQYQEFAEAIFQTPPDLSYCALLFARILSYPDLDIHAYIKQLDDLAAGAAQLLTADMSPLEKGEMIANFLFTLEGFKGNPAHYSDPRNSFLNELLDRRLGIPISLSLLYMAVAQRLELTVYGIGLPGHFIVAVQGEKRSQLLLLDPFHAGMRLTQEDCTRLVAQTTGYQGQFLSQWLDPTPPLLMITRMLNNLRLSYLSDEKWFQAGAVVRLLRIAQPSVPEHIRDEGLIAFQEKRYLHAAQLLEQYLAQMPHASDKEAIQQGVSQALGRWARQN